MNEGHPRAPAGVHHVAILVRDLAAAEAFYGGLLGLAVLRRWPADPNVAGGPERSIWLDAGGGAFLALERTQGAGGADAGGRAAEGELPGLHLVALRIPPEDRGGWERRLAAAGVAVYRRTDYTVYVRDPEGNRVGLSHWPDRPDEVNG
jgi:catechol 2,3-dioxygenase-like lactoylglutathione lyase family enzyme